MDLPDDHLRKRSSRIPQKLELFLNPGDAFGGLVFPQYLVVSLPAAAGLIHRADEAQLAAVSQLDDSRLAVHEATDVVGSHAHGLTMLLQEGV